MQLLQRGVLHGDRELHRAVQIRAVRGQIAGERQHVANA